MTTTSPPTYYNTNIYNNPSLTGTLLGTSDSFMLVSNTQTFFVDFSKSLHDPYFASAFENMSNI